MLTEEECTRAGETGGRAQGTAPPYDPHDSPHELCPDREDHDSHRRRADSCFGAFDRDDHTYCAKPDTLTSSPSEPRECSGSSGLRPRESAAGPSMQLQTQDATLLMPPTPPAAPANLLTSLRPSEAAVQLENAQDPYVACRLASATVLLHRAGRSQEAEMLCQFSVDVLGELVWSKCFEQYLAAAPELDDVTWAYPLVVNVVEELKRYEASYSKAMELEGMVPG